MSAVTSGLETTAVVCYCCNSIVPVFSYFSCMYGLVTYINNYTDMGTDYIFVVGFWKCYYLHTSEIIRISDLAPLWL